jgi:hypothetical protein
MSVIEIAKIKVRRGKANVEGVPQLDGGELGWAVDTQELYIGNGTTEEGAPAVGNTRLLTENDKPQFLSFATSTYIFANGSIPTIYTDPSGSAQIDDLTLQKKLDSWVTMVDFGISPGDSNAALGIQNAINQLYLNPLNKTDPNTRIALKIGAGIYNITATIYVPPNVTIFGDGKGKTILNMITTNTSVMQFCDIDSVLPGGFVVFEPGSNNITSDGRPTNITVSGITFKYDSTVVDYANVLPLLRADCVSNSSIVDCSFIGSTNTNVVNYSGIEMRGQDAITTENLTLDRVDFYGLGNAITSNYDVSNININNSSMMNLYRGLSFSDSIAVGNETGPTNVKVSNTVFENIRAEGWYVGSNTDDISTFHVSNRNTYRNVGNNLNGDLSAVTPVIQFLSNGNLSPDDYFSRYEVINSTSTAATFFQTIKGKTSVTQNAVYVKNIENSTSTVLAKLAYSGDDQYIESKYILRKPLSNISRKGKLQITISPDLTAVVSDNFSYSGPNDGGVIFSASLNTASNTVYVLYSSNSASGTLEYKFDQLQ